MDSCEVFMPSTSKIYDRYQFVPFVSASDENNTDKCNNGKRISNSNLAGEEASLFYREIISSPPTLSSSVEGIKKDQTVVKIKNYSALHNTRLTIFHYAQEGNIEGIEYLLSKQCVVDVQDMYGWTPLMCATFEGHYEVAEYLIKNGAKIDIKSKQGLTSLDIAIKKNNIGIINLFKNGIDKPANSDLEVKNEKKYCNVCRCAYTCSTPVHEKSIAHLFSIGKKNTSTYYYIPENNKGFQIMLKKGWDKNSGLGINANGRKFPVKTVLKRDRMCIGSKKEIPKVTHFGPNDYQSVIKSQPTLNFKKERRFKKWNMKKLEDKNRHFEIEFRRQFNL